MTMKKFTKILVILLSVALVCACLAVAISADGSNGQASYTDAGGSTVTASLADALANVPAGGTVTLEGDCTILATVKVNKSFSVNLNGYKLTTTAAAFVIEDFLKKGMATHSSILVWEISWIEEPGRQQFMRSQRVGHN